MPNLVLTPTAGAPTTSVSITSGSNKFSTMDIGACNISTIPSGLISPSSSSCFIDSTGALYSTAFVVSSSAAYVGYVINVTGLHGDFGLVGFTVRSFNVILSPNIGQPGQIISISALGATPSVGTSCAVTSDSSTLITSASAKVVSPGVVSGSFTVGSNAAGKSGGVDPKSVLAWNVTLLCSSNTASTGFTVRPKITLSPTAGVGNQTITIAGVGFRGDAFSCSVVSPVAATSPVPICSVTGTGTVSGQFLVKSGAADGSYNVTVVANLGFNATTQFNKVSGPSIFIYPGKVPPGYGTQDGTVVVSGGGFFTGSSRDCTSGLTSSGGAAFFATSPSKSCTIDTSGTLGGSFAVASGAFPGIYRINVTDPSTGARATYSNFTVSSIPLIQFNVTTAGIGQPVNINMTKPTLFSPFDVGPCTITAIPLSPALFSTYACTIDSNGNLTAPTFFRMATNTPTTYIVTITARHGETAANVFSPVGGPIVVVSPSFAVPSPTTGISVFVSVTGSGFKTSDTSCVITFSGNSSKIADNATCATVTGDATGSFRVYPSAPPGSYLVNVTGLPNKDAGFAIFDVAVTGIATATSTTYSPTSVSTIETTTETTTTGTYFTLTTTTFQTTGRSTEFYRTYTTTTISAQSTTSILSTVVTTSVLTATTLSFFTTLSSTIYYTLGQAIQKLDVSYMSAVLAIIGLAVMFAPNAFRRLLR